VIRFSAFLVVVAVGLLVAGVVTSKLMLVYVAIGVSGVALLALAVGALVKRKELFGPSTSAEPQLARPESAALHVTPAQAAPQPAPQAAPWQEMVPAGPAWPAAAPQPAPSRAGYRSAEQPLPPQPVPAPGQGTWEWPQDAPATQEMPRITSVPAPASSAPSESQPPQDQPPQDQPTAQAELPVLDELPAEDQHEAKDQPEAEHHHEAEHEETQILRAVTRAAADEAPAPPDAAPDAAPASAEEPEPAAVTPDAPDPVDLQREVTVVPGVPRYHIPHCLLIRFMGQGDLEKMTLGAARQAGCTPCRACLPDQPDADPELGPREPECQGEIVLDVLPPRIRTRPGLEHLDREHLAGNQSGVLGQGRDHIRVR
jgi:hypothetical protein